jgi:hypothetical protein
MEAGADLQGPNEMARFPRSAPPGVPQMPGNRGKAKVASFPSEFAIDSITFTAACE